MSLIDKKVLVFHAKNPVFLKVLEHPTHHGSAENISCGDSVQVQACVDDDVFVELAFQSFGCMLCRAATSCVLEYLVRKKIDDALRLTEADLLTMLEAPDISYGRRMCAALGLQAVRNMLGNEQKG